MRSQALISTLTDAERRFIGETTRNALMGLDEDDVLALFARARRLRDKYVSIYRRTAGAKVAEAGGRGASFEENQRDRQKAEVFEAALGRVSRRLGALAVEAAARIKQERLDAARAVKDAGPDVSAEPDDTAPAGRTRTARKTTGGLKRDASARAQGARRQAKRDAR